MKPRFVIEIEMNDGKYTIRAHVGGSEWTRNMCTFETQDEAVIFIKKLMSFLNDIMYVLKEKWSDD